MFHVFALTYTYYNLLRCVTREYTTTNNEKYSIYTTREYTIIFDLHDAYYSLLEWYMKHVFVAGLLTGDFFSIVLIGNLKKNLPLEDWQQKHVSCTTLVMNNTRRANRIW